MILVGFDIWQKLFQTVGHSRKSTKYNSTFKVSVSEIGFNPDSQKVI
jgi:hypothetical protein